VPEELLGNKHPRILLPGSVIILIYFYPPRKFPRTFAHTPRRGEIIFRDIRTKCVPTIREHYYTGGHKHPEIILPEGVMHAGTIRPGHRPPSTVLINNFFVRVVYALTAARSGVFGGGGCGAGREGTGKFDPAPGRGAHRCGPLLITITNKRVLLSAY